MKKYLFQLMFLFFIMATASIEGQTDTSSRPIESAYPLIYPEEEGTSPIVKETDTFQMKFFNMLMVLALLIGFMILASYMLKRMMSQRVTQMNDTSVVKVLETRSLSPRSTLYLLDVKGRGLLIAESPAGVSALTMIPLEDFSSDT